MGSLKRYRVTVSETYSLTFDCNASSREEAEAEFRKAHDEGLINMTPYGRKPDRFDIRAEEIKVKP